MISAGKAKQLDATTMFTYSHANTPLAQSERAYYLVSYFIKIDNSNDNSNTNDDRMGSPCGSGDEIEFNPQDDSFIYTCSFI